MERASGAYFRGGFFAGLAFLPLTGGVLWATGDPDGGLFVTIVGAVLISIAYVDYRIFRHKHPPMRVP